MIKMCCCKRNFIYQKLLFTKGKTYEYEEEEDTIKSVFVYYNKNGKSGFKGYRFYINKNSSRNMFSDYFYSERKMKLEKLKKLNLDD